MISRFCSYQKGALIGGVIYLHDINRNIASKSVDFLHKLCREDALSKSPVLFLTSGWDRAVASPLAKVKFAEGLASQYEGSSLKSVAGGRASVHHILPSGRFLHPPTGLDLHLQDPWEMIQNAMTSLHGYDMAHRIRLCQDKLVGMPSSFRRSMTGEALRKDLQALQDRAKALENAGQDDETLWNELRWDSIRVTAGLSEPVSRRRRLKKWFRDLFSALFITMRNPHI